VNGGPAPPGGGTPTTFHWTGWERGQAAADGACAGFRVVITVSATP
jgi:hypothetical protein